MTNMGTKRRPSFSVETERPPGLSGRPRWHPTPEQREQVKTLAGRGVPQRMVASIIGVDDEVLLRECREEWEHGRAIAVANVTGVLYRRAISDDPQSFRDRQFYLVNIAGMASNMTKLEASSLEALVASAMGVRTNAK